MSLETQGYRAHGDERARSRGPRARAPRPHPDGHMMPVERYEAVGEIKADAAWTSSSPSAKAMATTWAGHRCRHRQLHHQAAHRPDPSVVESYLIQGSRRGPSSRLTTTGRNGAPRRSLRDAPKDPVQPQPPLICVADDTRLSCGCCAVCYYLATAVGSAGRAPPQPRPAHPQPLQGRPTRCRARRGLCSISSSDTVRRHEQPRIEASHGPVT
jgi:hypothetical protein